MENDQLGQVERNILYIWKRFQNQTADSIKKQREQLFVVNLTIYVLISI